MDIRKWLDETVLPEQPLAQPRNLGLAPFLCVKEAEHQEGKPQRKRRNSDSSLLEVRTKRKGSHVPEAALVGHAPIDNESDIVEDGASGTGCTSASYRHISSQLSQPYARRPRRKTRPERYEPVAAKGGKERGTYVHHRRKGESVKIKRKSARKKADKPGVGLVQSFSAKNVHGDRLTLKPREKLGIFGKGKVSSPVKGRGLPDLVFSEMKFLQKHKGQPDAAPRSGLSKKKRRKDHAIAKEEEISAYFNSVRRPLAEKDKNTQAKGVTHHTASAQNRAHGHEPADSSVLSNAIPTVELPDREAYSSFGSRGPQHDSGSYISWSESARAPSVVPLRREAGFTINNGQLDAPPGQNAEVVRIGEDLMHSHTRRSSPARHRKDGSKERFKVSSVAPSHRVSRSQSYPQQTCSPYPLNSYRAVERHPTTNSGARHSSLPPPEPLSKRIKYDQPVHCHTRLRRCTGQSSGSIEERKRSAGQAETLRKEATLPSPDNYERPTSSSSLDKLLKECNSAFDEQRRQDPGARKMIDLQVERGPEEPGAARVASRMPTLAVPNPPTVRFSCFEEHVPQIPNFTDPGLYEEQERRRDLVETASVHDSEIYHKAHDGGQSLMGEGPDDVDYDEQCWNDEFLPELVIPRGGDAVALEEDEAAMYHYQLQGLRSTAGRGDTAASRGFWRPHRLY